MSSHTTTNVRLPHAHLPSTVLPGTVITLSLHTDDLRRAVEAATSGADASGRLVLTGGDVAITAAGVLFALGSAVSFSIYLLVSRRAVTRTDPMVNAAWVAFAALAFNLARAASIAAGMATARWATLRRRIITVPARLAATGRRLVMHLPTRWPWAPAWAALWDVATGPPRPVTT